MGVSWNGGAPKSSTLMGFSLINHPCWGTPIYGNLHMVESGRCIEMYWAEWIPSFLKKSHCHTSKQTCPSMWGRNQLATMLQDATSYSSTKYSWIPCSRDSKNPEQPEHTRFETWDVMGCSPSPRCLVSTALPSLCCVSALDVSGSLPAVGLWLNQPLTV